MEDHEVETLFYGILIGPGQLAAGLLMYHAGNPGALFHILGAVMACIGGFVILAGIPALIGRAIHGPTSTPKPASLKDHRGWAGRSSRTSA